MKTFVEACCLTLLLGASLSAGAQTDDWRVRHARVNDHLYDITYGGGLYVAVGNHRTILTSRDGTNWALRSRNAGAPGWLSGIAYGNRTFVAVGSGYQPDNPLSSRYGPPGSDGYTIGTNHYPVLVSRNGILWQPRRGAQKSLTAVAYGQGLFVAVGRDGLLTSHTGHSWFRPTNFFNWSGNRISHLLTPPDLKELAFGNGRFVVMGERSNLIISTNGWDWVNYTRYDTGSYTWDTYFTALAYNGSAFIAGAWGGQAFGVYTSLNGADWSEMTAPSFSISDFALGVGNVIAVGVDLQGGRTQVSLDGLDWSGQPLLIPGRPYAVAHGLYGFVIVGANGLILHSTL